MNGGVVLATHLDPTDPVTRETRTHLVRPLPEVVDNSVRNLFNEESSISTLLSLAADYMTPVIDVSSINSLISTGQLIDLGSETIAGVATRKLQVPGIGTGASRVMTSTLWIIESTGVKLQSELQTGASTGLRFAPITPTLGVGIDPELISGEVHDEYLTRDISSATFDKIETVAQVSGQAKLINEHDVELVVEPSQSTMPSGFVLGEQVLVTATLRSLDPDDSYEPPAAGWFVTQEVTATTSGARILVIQGRAGQALPIGLDAFWPDSPALEGATWPIGTGSVYAEREDRLVGDDLLGDLVRTAETNEIASGEDTLLFDYILSFLIKGRVRCVLLGADIEESDLLSVATGYLSGITP